MFRFRFGQEKDFQTNMSYRCYITEVHFMWECPMCGVVLNQYHEDDCPIERKESDGEVFQKVSIANESL
jgi:rubrerythrin